LNLPPRERRPQERSAFRRFLANLQEDNMSRYTFTAVLPEPIEGTIVEIIDPAAAFGIAGSPGVTSITTDAGGRLRRALDAVTLPTTADRPIEHSSAPTHQTLS
jgi:hypothetical protein